ncbi:MAG: hypothetical protein ACJ8G5_17215 [Burkholderiales bacterium]
MDTINRSSKAVQVRDTIVVIAILAAAHLAWRTLIGQDNGVLHLIQRLF